MLFRSTPTVLCLWSLSKNQRSGLPDRMMVLCLRQHYLLGGVILQAQTTAHVAVVWLRLVRLVVVMRPAWGRRWCISFSGVSLGCPSCGLRLVAVHAQDPPMVAVVLRRASGSWCCLGSLLLNDDAMMPPQPANRLDRPWRISQSRFVLRFGTR